MSKRNQKKILIIEDDPDLAMVVEIALTMTRPWQVIISNSGQEGLEIAQSNRFHAILLDLTMPDMSGTEVLAHLRQDERTVHTPVVLLTAINSLNQNDFTQWAIAGLIQKPFDPVTLADTISQILRW